MSPDPSHYVRRVVLPSGKTIEVVYFEDRPSAEPEPADDLSVCGTCDSKLVYPIDWHEAGTRHWQVKLRCPNCQWIGTGIFEQAVVERFDRDLDRATDSLITDLTRLEQANMKEEIERFCTALDADAITPEDF